MEFELDTILFLDFKELEFVKQFMDNYDLAIGSTDTEECIYSVYIDPVKITIEFILELEDALDSRITLCNRYLGSSDTIRSIGLD